MKIKVDKVDDLKKVAKNLIDKINKSNFKNAVVVSLEGDLGSGKTTFTKVFATLLGIKNEVLSPTFIISKEYRIPKNKYVKKNKLIHIDAYRLNSERDLEFIGFNEHLESSDNIIFIEWASIVKKGLPKDYLEIFFKYIDKNSREVDF